MQDKNKRNTREIHQKYMMEILPFDWPVRSSSLLSLALDAKFKATLPVHSILGDSPQCFCIFVFLLYFSFQGHFSILGEMFLYLCIVVFIVKFNFSLFIVFLYQV